MLEQLAWIGTGRCEPSSNTTNNIIMAFLFLAVVVYTLLAYRILRNPKIPSLAQRGAYLILFSICFGVASMLLVSALGYCSDIAG